MNSCNAYSTDTRCILKKFPPNTERKNETYETHIAWLEGFTEKWVKLIETDWTAVGVLKEFMIKQLYNMYIPELCTHMHEGGKTDLYKLASISDQHTAALILVKSQPHAETKP